MDLMEIFIQWKKDNFNLWIYLIGIICFLVIYLQKNYIRLVKIALGLDGFPALPLIGNVRNIFTPNSLNELEKYSSHNMIRFWICIIPSIMIIRPESIKKVLNNSEQTKKPSVYFLFRNYLGKGLITSQGETYKLHQKILQNFFTVPKMKMFNKTFLEHAEYLVSTFRDNINQDINITKFINNTVYNIQAEIILNLKFTKENNETSFYPFKVNEMYADYRFKRPWLMFESLYKLTKHSKIDEKQYDDNYAYCYNIIKEIEESKKKDKQQRNDKISLIEYLIDAKQNYSNFNNNDILDEVGTFMLAGLESVSTATTLGLFLLANHPEWQEKCFEELKQIFEDCSTLTSVDSFKKMKYLEMCIKETLRLYPTVVTICRRLCKDTEIDGQTLPVGTHVLISPYITHRIPDYYPDPESFKPERFDLNNSKKLDPYAYIPFSIGNRKCIGNKFSMLEMKAIFSTIIRNFILEPVENKHKINVKFRLTLRASGGVWIKFRPREPMTDFYTNM